MCCTKRKILDISLRLYNKCGINNVSQRMISKDLGISPGNLTYHFKKTEDILEQLFLNMVEEIDVIVENGSSRDFSITDLINLYQRVVLVLHRNKFFMIDFVHIIRHCDRINEKYRQITEKRHLQFLQTIIDLTDNGYIKPPSFPGEYKALYERMTIISDFWMSKETIIEGSVSEESINHYMFINLAQIYPYLTEKGRDDFSASFGMYMTE
ncbi:MAG: TetR/AcrR family transcriptional regulator [Flavobacteriales bacterium]